MIALAAPEPNEEFHFVMVDGKFILLGSIDDFLEKINKKNSGNGLQH